MQPYSKPIFHHNSQFNISDRINSKLLHHQNNLQHLKSNTNISYDYQKSLHNYQPTENTKLFSVSNNLQNERLTARNKVNDDIIPRKQTLYFKGIHEEKNCQPPKLSHNKIKEKIKIQIESPRQGEYFRISQQLDYKNKYSKLVAKQNTFNSHTKTPSSLAMLKKASGTSETFSLDYVQNNTENIINPEQYIPKIKYQQLNIKYQNSLNEKELLKKQLNTCKDELEIQVQIKRNLATEIEEKKNLIAKLEQDFQIKIQKIQSERNEKEKAIQDLTQKQVELKAKQIELSTLNMKLNQQRIESLLPKQQIKFTKKYSQHHNMGRNENTQLTKQINRLKDIIRSQSKQLEFVRKDLTNMNHYQVLYEKISEISQSTNEELLKTKFALLNCKHIENNN